MSVSTNHLFGLVSDPLIDRGLWDSCGTAVGTEGMAENVPAAKNFPATPGQSFHKMIVSLVLTQCRLTEQTVFRRIHAERFLAAWMFFKPFG